MKLKDISVNKRGYYGLGARACNKNLDYPSYLRITDINDNGNIQTPLMASINPSEYPEYKNFLLKENDIVFARTGNSTGRNAFIKNNIKNTVFAGFLIKFSISHPDVIPQYIGYYFQSIYYRNQIKSIFTGSTRPNVNAEQYGELEIPIPILSIQQHIVGANRICYAS